MSLYFRSLSSGSSGNCYLVWSPTTVLLVDSGIAAKKIIKGVEDTQMSLEDIQGILVTHEHSDHIKSLHTIHKQIQQVSIYGSQGTLGELSRDSRYDREIFIKVSPEQKLLIGDIEVQPFKLSHDAKDPLGYAFACGGSKISIVTDTGHISSAQKDVIRDSTLLVLEANHERNILFMSGYPYELKRRIAGDNGHLSNEDTAECIADILRTRETRDMPHVVLAHLSRENNSPEMAEITIKNILFESGYIEGTDYKMSVARRDELGPIIEA